VWGPKPLVLPANYLKITRQPPNSYITGNRFTQASMRTVSPQYEHVPGSNEGHDTPSHDQHYSSHETVELKPLGWQAENIPESYQSFQHNRESTPYVDAHQNDNQGFDSWRPKETTSIDIKSLRHRHRGVTFGRLSNWWWWELGSVVLSLSCIIAIVVTLLVMQNKPLSSWHSSIAPNALISVGKVETRIAYGINTNIQPAV
jgi:hypothetical protein